MDLLIKNALVPGYDGKVDVAVEGERITAVEPSIDAEAARVIDACGKVLIPTLVESHIHLDKAFVMDRLPNKSGTL